MGETIRDAGGAIHVTGLTELARDLKKTAPELGKAVRKVNLEAAKTIESAAKLLAEGVGRQAQGASEALRTTATPQAAYINLTEDADHPFALGAEFGAKHDIERTRGVKRIQTHQGSRVDKKTGKTVKDSRGNRYIEDRTGAHAIKGWNQFKDWRGNQWAPDTENGVGYFLHPAVRDTHDVVIAEYGHAIEALLQRNVFYQ